jgi:hypothetical protein
LLQDLRGAQAHRGAVEAALAQSRATVFLGHGTWDTLEGDAVLVDDKNVGLAQDGILIAIACRSARSLGQAAIEAGVAAYVGFDDDLVFPFGKLSDRFGEAAMAGILALLESASVAEGADRMRRGFEAALYYFKDGAGRSDPSATLYWLIAAWDRDHVAVKGLPTATLG